MESQTQHMFWVSFNIFATTNQPDPRDIRDLFYLIKQPSMRFLNECVTMNNRNKCSDTWQPFHTWLNKAEPDWPQNPLSVFLEKHVLMRVEMGTASNTSSHSDS